MTLAKKALLKVMAGLRTPPTPAPRRSRRANLSWDHLEERTVLSHITTELHAAVAHHAAKLHHHAHTSTTAATGTTVGTSTAGTTSTTTTAASTSTDSSSSSAGTSTSSTTSSDGSSAGCTTTTSATDSDATSASSSQLGTDVQQLRSDILSIQTQSTVTVAQLAALRADFVTLANSGLYPNGQELATFENDLLTAVAASRTAGSSGMLTADQTTTLQGELGTAFSSSVASSTALAQLYSDTLAIAQASNINTANITTITTDQAKIQADLASADSSASSSTTTTTTAAPTCGGEGSGGHGPAENLATATVASLLVPGFAGTGHYHI
jgi:hypothetical protein